MIRTNQRAFCLLIFCGVALGQAPSPSPHFDAASVKPAARPGPGQGSDVRGGPGTNDPGQIAYTRVFMSQVLRKAFGVVWDFQFSGPNWLDAEMYTINAKIPPGTTQEQFQLMLQNLLAERFGLKFHREKKVVPAYELVVADGGPKLKESAPETGASESAAAPPRTLAVDQDLFPVLPPGVNSRRSITNMRARHTMRNTSMSQLAGILERETDRPVADKTGLIGKYDFKLEYSIEGLGGQMYVARAQQGLDANTQNDGGPSLFNALQQQLGLRLIDQKDPFDVIVIDHLEKVPAEN